MNAVELLNSVDFLLKRQQTPPRAHRAIEKLRQFQERQEKPKQKQERHHTMTAEVRERIRTAKQEDWARRRVEVSRVSRKTAQRATDNWLEKWYADWPKG